MPGPEDFTEEELQVLRPLFTSSNRDHLEAFGQALSGLERDPNDPAQLELLHRSIHSVKGAAFQLGIIHIGALARAMEEVAKAARLAARAPAGEESRLLAESRQLLLTYLDAFERREEVPAPPAGLLARLQAAARAPGEDGEHGEHGEHRQATGD